MNAAGLISDNLEAFRKQLADCSQYQSFLGVSTSAAAVERTYLAALPKPADGCEYTLEELAALRPFAVLSLSMANGIGLRSDGVGAWRCRGRFVLWLEAGVPTAYQPGKDVDAIDLTADLETGDRWIQNLIGNILPEIADAGSGVTPGYLPLNSVDVRMGPSREPNDATATQGPHYVTVLEFEWGAE